jgi:hypothetical protein
MSAAGINRRQGGAASLLIALVLMMLTTLITLSVARTQVTETRITANDNWHSRLRLISQAGWERATTELTVHPPKLKWVSSDHGSALVSHITPDTGVEDIETRVTFRKTDDTSRLVSIQAVTSHHSGTGLTGRISQTVQLLTVLSPQAEGAPPLVINGCLSAGTPGIDIRPLNSDHDDAADAVWHFGDSRCLALDTIDVHGGQRIEIPIPLNNTLWSTLFSVSPEEYAELAVAELTLPADQRRYWLAEPADLVDGKWTRSLGSADTPVVLVFPQASGCPRFAGGVRIVGFVFIDSACPDPLADTSLEITGTLGINGDADTGNGSIRLNHIQTVESGQTRLSFPVLRAVKIPGTWNDF